MSASFLFFYLICLWVIVHKTPLRIMSLFSVMWWPIYDSRDSRCNKNACTVKYSRSSRIQLHIHVWRTMELVEKTPQFYFARWVDQSSVTTKGYSLLLLIAFSGAIHGDDLGYVFIPKVPVFPSRNLTATSPEVITKNRMVRFIGNFVKYGYELTYGSPKSLYAWHIKLSVLFYDVQSY